MSVVQTRGGIPIVRREAITVAGRKVRLPVWIQHLKVRTADYPVKLYFSEEDFDSDINYVLIPVPAAETPYGEWEGPVETAADKYTDLWFDAVGGTANIEMVAFQRRG